MRLRSPSRHGSVAPLRTALCALLLSTIVARGMAADALEEIEKSAAEWVKLRVESARLASGWEEDRALVESMTRALNERAAAVEEKRDLRKAQTAQDREELDALRARSRTAAEDLRTFEARLENVKHRLLALRPNLPPRLSDALEMSYRSLTDAQIGPAERMQFAMTVLNRCAQFNRTITTGEDVLTLEGEPAAKSVTVIYWGLGQGYAIDRATHKAWIGTPSAQGWRWQATPAAFDPVARLIAIARDHADPDFVAVPATVARSAGPLPKN